MDLSANLWTVTLGLDVSQITSCPQSFITVPWCCKQKKLRVCTFLGSTFSKLDGLQRPSLVMVGHALYCLTKDPQWSTVRVASHFLCRHHNVIYYFIQWSMIHIAVSKKLDLRHLWDYLPVRFPRRIFHRRTGQQTDIDRSVLSLQVPDVPSSPHADMALSLQMSLMIKPSRHSYITHQKMYYIYIREFLIWCLQILCVEIYNIAWVKIFARGDKTFTLFEFMGKIYCFFIFLFLHDNIKMMWNELILRFATCTRK